MLTKKLFKMKDLTGIITGVLILLFLGFLVIQNCECCKTKCATEEVSDEVVEEDIRDKEGVCGDCMDGYEENDDGKCVESQSNDENGETEPQEGTNWPLLGGGIAVLGLGAYFVLNK